MVIFFINVVVMSARMFKNVQFFFIVVLSFIYLFEKRDKTVKSTFWL